MRTYKYLLVEFYIEEGLSRPCWNYFECGTPIEARNKMRERLLEWAEYESTDDMEDALVDFGFNGDNAYCFTRDGMRVDFKIFGISKDE